MGQEAEEKVLNGTENSSEQSGSANSASAQAQSAQAPDAQAQSGQASNAQAQNSQVQNAQTHNDQAQPKKPMRITSPEQVDDYIRVTTPGMWLLAIAMMILLCALLIWGFTTKVMMKTTDPKGQVTTEYVAPASFLTDASTGS